MASVSTNDFKNGWTIMVDGNLMQVVEFQHVKPGKGPAFVRTKIKNVRTGSVIEKTFRAGESVDRVNIDKRGGGRLVFFVSDKNIPVRSFRNYSESYKIKPKKVLLVGLGSLLYRSPVMYEFGEEGLLEAVEGYWTMNDKC